MSLVGWVLGWLALIGIISGIGSAAWGLQRRFLPDWGGANAVLAGAVIGISLLLGVAQILGVLGVLRTATLLAATTVLGIVLRPTHLRAPHRHHPGAEGEPGDTADEAVGEEDHRRTTRSPTERVVNWLAVGSVALVMLNWLTRLEAVYRHGTSDGDSLMYHLPFATRFVQTGSITDVPHIGPDAWVAFYPANMELLQATIMLPLHHLAVVPLLNLGWVVLAMLAAWCLGQRAGRGSLGLVLAAPVLTLPVLVATNAGTGRVDIAASALLLAAIALILHEPRTIASSLISGLALGIALGTKFSLVPPVALLLIGVVAVLIWRRAPWQAAAFSGGVISLSAIWFIRNWATAGSPVPMLTLRAGPIGFPEVSPERFEYLEGTSIVDHLTGDDPDFLDSALPAFDFAFGSRIIGALLLLAALGTVVGVVRRRPIGLPHVAALALLGMCVAYPFSPLSVGYPGRSGNVIGVLVMGLNTRYLLPGLLGLMCLATLALPRMRERWTVILVSGSALALAVYSTFRGLFRDEVAPGVEWPVVGADIVWGAVITSGVALVTGGVIYAYRTKQEGLLALAGNPIVVGSALGLLLVPLSWLAVREENLNRYEATGTATRTLWASVLDLPDGQRVGIMGEWLQQPYVRDDLGNEVQYLGTPADHGLFDPPQDCTALQRILQADHYDVAVAHRGILSVSDNRQANWLTSIPGAEVLAESSQGVVVKLPSAVEVPCANAS